MKNRVVIFSDNRSVFNEIEKAFIKRGLFDFSFFVCCNLDECCTNCKLAKLNAEQTVVVCKNEYVDLILQQVRQSSDDVSLLFDQAVKLVDKNKTNKMLILPLELEKDKFFDEFLPKREVFACSVFGKTLSFLEERFKQFASNFKIISKTPLLHTIFYTKEIDVNLLKSALEDGLFSLQEESLALKCAKLIKQKCVSVSFVEQATSGNVVAKFLMESDVKICNSHILLDDKNLTDFGISEQLISQNGVVSKEVVYELSKRLLEKCESQVAVSVVGDASGSGRTFIAVGNKEIIHVFSSTLHGSKAEIMEEITNLTIFKLLRFLEENY